MAGVEQGSYPRKSGAAFAYAAPDSGADKPFAALAKLKAKPSSGGADAD